MNKEELLQREPYLTISNDGKVLIIPSGKRGYTSFPTSEDVVVKEAVVQGGKIVTPQEVATKPLKGAVSISIAEYELLQSGGGMWSGGRVVAYVPSANEALLAQKTEQQTALWNELTEAETHLEEKDYIGRKISEAVLLGDKNELEALRVKYESDILAAKVYRETVSRCRSALDILEEEIKKLQEVVGREN